MMKVERGQRREKIEGGLATKASRIDRILCVFNIPLLFLIILNVVAVVLETEEQLGSKFEELFLSFEIFSVVAFSLEFVLRLWSCTGNYKYRHPILGRIRYLVSPMALIDLIAILPFYIPLLIPFDMRIVRVLRLMRLFRLFKLGRYSNALTITSHVLRNKREELVISVFVIVVLVILSSSLMYSVEHEVQPEAYPSILSTMRWCPAALSTTGYGASLPITPLGKLLGSIIAFLRIGVFALPTGILASGFIEAVKANRRVTCPHCKKVI